MAQEIRTKGPGDVTAAALESTSWLEEVPAPPVPPDIQVWGLGLGESSVLALAVSRPQMVAIIDDLPARKCAESLDLPVRGTLGIVLVAKRRGLIPAARPVLEDLIQSGMYLSRRVLDEALRRVGE